MKTLTLILWWFIPLIAFTQKGEVNGRIVDAKTKQPLPHATVALLKATDSSVVVTDIATKEGSFKLKQIDYNDYHLLVSYVGYGHLRSPFKLNKPIISFDTLMLHEGVTLDSVKIVEKIAIVIKKDTIEFAADAFKTKPDALLEDLLKKLPGVEVDKQGNITAHGQRITEILVDGKPFFGGNYKIASQNLPKEIIDKVQLIDKKSEQAEATGTEDGQQRKVLNVTIKKDKKYGTFGNVSAGVGTENRYEGGGMLNLFRDKKQLSVLGSINNLNRLGFNSDDLDGFGGGSMWSMLGGGSMMMNSDRRGNITYMGGDYGGFGNMGGGINRNGNVGVNYRNTLGKNTDVSGSYFFANNYNYAENQSNRESFLPDARARFKQENNSNGLAYNHRLNININHKIDSMSSISARATVSYNASSQNQAGVFDNTNLTANTIIAQGRQIFESEAEGWSTYLQSNYYKRFKKKGRVLYLNFTHNFQSNLTENLNNTVGNSNPLSNLNQKQWQEYGSNRYFVSASYNEPIFKKTALNLNLTKNNMKSEQRRNAYDFVTADNGYTNFNSLFSNDFRNVSIDEGVGVSISQTYKRFVIRSGITAQNIKLRNFNLTRDSITQQHRLTFMPNASATLSSKKNGSVSLNYSGRQRTPTAQELQPVPDITNPFFIKIGNPNLLPEFSHSFYLSSNYYDVGSNLSLRINSSANITQRKITPNVVFDLNTGRQTSTVQNTDGNYFVQTYFNISKTIKPRKLTLGSNISGSISRQNNFVNGVLNSVHFNSISGYINASLDREKLDLRLNAGTAIQDNNYSIQKLLNNRNQTWLASLDVSYQLPNDILLEADATYNKYTGFAGGFNRNLNIINIVLSKKLLPKKLGTISFIANDILNQNNNIRRIATTDGIEDSNSLILRRYFLLKFVYRVSKFKK